MVTLLLKRLQWLPSTSGRGTESLTCRNDVALLSELLLSHDISSTFFCVGLHGPLLQFLKCAVPFSFCLKYSFFFYTSCLYLRISAHIISASGPESLTQVLIVFHRRLTTVCVHTYICVDYFFLIH